MGEKNKKEIPPLWQHQIDAIQKAKPLFHFALFMEMGTGKTRTAIEILRQKAQDMGRIPRTLVFCPPIVIPQWKEEFLKYTQISPSEVSLLIGSQIKRIYAMEKGTILVTNYESLLMKDLFDKMLAWDPDVIILDEAHKIKNPDARRSKAAHALGKSARFRYILTGTPILNTPMDLFSQFRFLDLGKTFGQNFYAFRNTYFFDRNEWMKRAGRAHFPDWKPRPYIEEKIATFIEPVSVRIKKTECLDLPPLVKQKIYVELSHEQQKHYDAMKKDFIAYVGDQACVAQLAITKALRLQEIVSGYIKVDRDPTKATSGKSVAYQDTPREEALRELLTELTPSHKVIVWAVFKNNYEQIKRVCEAIGVGYTEVHGEVTPKNKTLAVKEFSEDPNVRVYIGHPGSGGIGVNLTVSSYSIFYSRNFSLEHSLQAEARNHRSGSERHEKITRIDLVAPGTIDELVLEALDKKISIGEKIVFQLASKLAS